MLNKENEKPNCTNCRHCGGFNDEGYGVGEYICNHPRSDEIEEGGDGICIGWQRDILPIRFVQGSKRTNISRDEDLGDWFMGFGKDDSCHFEGTWWDMICFARNVLASENTRLCAPEFYHPEMKNLNHCGEEKPYEYEAIE